MRKTNRTAVWGAAAGLIIMACGDQRFSAAAGAPLPPAINAPGNIHVGLGQLEPSTKLLGREIRGPKNDKLGKLENIVVDLESGRALYAVVSVDGGRVGVPPELFSQSAENQPLRVSVDKQTLSSAPRFTSDIENNLASTAFASAVYRHFNQPIWWEGAGQPAGKAFGNVRKASELAGMTVKSSANENLGKVDSVVIDLTSGRVPFVVLSPSSGGNQMLYPIPANAFTSGSDPKTLTTGLDRTKLQAAPKIAKNNWRQLSDMTFASSVYQYYGKQPFWHGDLAPTGRDAAKPKTP